MEVPVLSKFLQTTSIPLTHLGTLFLIATSLLFAMELYKMIKYRKDV